MSEKRLNGRIVNKHDIEANWLKATNFTPMLGELIVYDVDENYDHERIKIGDGTKNVSELPFCTDSVNALSIDITDVDQGKATGINADTVGGLSADSFALGTELDAFINTVTSNYGLKSEIPTTAAEVGARASTWLPTLSDLKSIQLGSWDGNTAPSSMPVGISYTLVYDATGTGFPISYATCLAVNGESSFRNIQILVEKTSGRMYVRSATDGSTWGEWQRYIRESDIMKPAAVHLRSSSTVTTVKASNVKIPLVAYRQLNIAEYFTISGNTARCLKACTVILSANARLTTGFTANEAVGLTIYMNGSPAFRSYHRVASSSDYQFVSIPSVCYPCVVGDTIDLYIYAGTGGGIIGNSAGETYLNIQVLGGVS